jgi:aspartate/methionine/tyrosine aminotransferase
VPRGIRHQDGAPLRLRVRELLAARYGVPLAHIATAQGTSGAVFAAIAALSTLHPERRTLLIETPGYDIFGSVGRLLGLDVRTFERPRAERWRIEDAHLAARVHDGVLAICATDLHNPTGMRLDDDGLLALTSAAERVGAWVLLDEVYRDFLPGAVGTVYRDGRRIVTTSSLTKCYGVAGPRCGWIFAPPDVVERLDMVSEITCGVLPSTSHGPAVRGLELADASIARARRTAARALPVIDAWVERTPGVSWTPPDGGHTGLVFVDGLSDSTALSRRLRVELDVQVVPGAYFGCEGSLRVSFGLPPAQLQQALDVLALGLGALVG